MTISDILSTIDGNGIGKEMHDVVTELFPICRSITGNGFRQSMKILRQHIPLDIHEVTTGTPAFDWTVPKEWNVKDAYVKNSTGRRVIDFQRSNLHLLNYSIPIRATMSLSELKDHLYTIPEKPDLVPYRTSYYKENWGFCLSHNALLQLEEGDYEVVIDSSLEEGHLTYGEYLIKGETANEVLISAHSCHPSLCNDNLSGVIVSVFLAKLLRQLTPRYSYRFLYLPGTIGPIVWLSRNEDAVTRIKHGIVAACVGDSGPFTYKKSRAGNAEIDRIVEHVLEHSGYRYSTREFSPYGYDERQYCSPGFNLAVGSLTRTPHGEFPQYHTSADNLEFVRPEYLAESLIQYLTIVSALETNKTYVNLSPNCEPQLGKRGLYSLIGGRTDSSTRELAMLWVLNLSDGNNSLLDIAQRAHMQFAAIAEAAKLLTEHNLLKECA